jgi:hypothetical protein
MAPFSTSKTQFGNNEPPKQSALKNCLKMRWAESAGTCFENWTGAYVQLERTYIREDAKRRRAGAQKRASDDQPGRIFKPASIQTVV